MARRTKTNSSQKIATKIKVVETLTSTFLKEKYTSIKIMALQDNF